MLWSITFQKKILLKITPELWEKKNQNCITKNRNVVYLPDKNNVIKIDKIGTFRKVKKPLKIPVSELYQAVIQ